MLLEGLEIGGLTVLTEFSGARPEVRGAHRAFLCHKEPRQSDLLLRFVPMALCDRLAFFSPLEAEEVFDSGGLWRLTRDPENSTNECLEIFDRSQSETEPYLKTYFNLRDGFGISGFAANPFGVGEHVQPLFYPLDELLWIQLLSRKSGILLHAFSCVWQGQAFCFAGVSGSGKTTLARIFREQIPDIQILSDERVVVRPEECGYRVYGTPWHGDGLEWLQASAPLGGIFLIEHGRENQIVPISGTEAFRRLFLCTFPPLYKEAAMQEVLEFLSKKVERVPMHRLLFRPDAGVIDFLQPALKKTATKSGAERGLTV